MSIYPIYVYHFGDTKIKFETKMIQSSFLMNYLRFIAMNSINPIIFHFFHFFRVNRKKYSQQLSFKSKHHPRIESQ